MSDDEYSDEFSSEEDEDAPPPTSFDIDQQLASKKYETTNLVRVFESAEILNYEFLVESGFEHPMVFQNMAGLSMKVPDKRFSVIQLFSI